MENESSYFDKYFLVGQNAEVTAQIKNIILANRDYISPVYESFSSLCASNMNSIDSQTLVLVDIVALTVEDLLKLISAHQSAAGGYSNLSIAFFNVPKSALDFPLLCIPGIRGLLQREIDEASLAEGIMAISRGERWFARDLISEITALVRIDTEQSTDDSTQLTAPEREVLKYLSMGASKKEIADNTQVDASTVKNQIGDIYKKLNRKNHTTALGIAGNLTKQGSALPEWEALEAV